MAQREPPRRPTLGLVTANIHLGVGATLWAGVLAAAERADVNVVCFPGGEVRADGAPRGALYELVGPARLDGVISWTSTLGVSAARAETAERFARRLRGLPVVSLNSVLDGHETLRCDSHAGMREAVRHLVEAHGRRRPACVRGPLANPVSAERYRAYTDALARHRVPLDRSLVAAATGFSSGAGAAALRVLLDVRGLRPGRDFDALVACSDALAADALRLLGARGVRVPEDVAVISFNDSLEARLSDPPLTSVSLPFAELGELAVDTLVARLRGRRPPARTAVAGTLVTRRSCGCHSPLVAQGGGADGTPAATAFPHSGRQLAAAFAADLAPAPYGRQGADGHGGAFLSLLERVIGTAVRTFEDASAWESALLRARDGLPPRLSPTARVRAERLLGQARLMVADKAHRLLEYARWAEQQESRRLRELGTALATAVTVDEVADTLARRLPALEVPDCRLVLYEGAAAGVRTARLVPRPGEPGPGTRFPADRLLPDEALPGGRFTLVVEPLHIGAEHFGFALFDAGTRGAAGRGALCRALGDQISAALKGVRLFDEVRRARDAAEQASRLKTRLLDNATDELRTPVERILRHAAFPVPPARPGAAPLRRVREEAGPLLRLIDDLLDLSRSEADALDLSWQLLDPLPLITDTFRAAAGSGPRGAWTNWRLRLPSRLPAVRADAARLRQIILTLTETVAAHSTGSVRLDLSASVRLPVLRIRVACPDLAMSEREAERLFTPFGPGRAGMRLGPAIARRLAVLHGGTVTLDTAGTTAAPLGFTLDLPLPTRAQLPGPAAPDGVLLVAGAPPAEAAGLGRDLLRAEDDPEAVPAAVVWDTACGGPQEWSAVQRLYDDPALRHTPFLLYGRVAGDGLGGALDALRPPGLGAPVLVVDGQAASRRALRALVSGLLPGRPVRTAADGTSALALLGEELPSLLVTARTLGDMEGFDLVERLSEGAGRPAPAVLLLSDEGFTAADVRRAEPHPHLVLLGRDILTEAETGRLLRALTGEDGPRPGGGAPVRQALVYFEQHYRHRISRWQVAQAAGVSEDHLSRLFHREFGLTLWEYLTRLRVQRAKERLRLSDDSVQAVARAVGFHDRAYFSRVFRKVTGVAPHAFREPSAG